MERRLQKVNQRSRLVERGRQAEACRNSGQRVSEWRGEHGIPVSTYYSWQRKVFQAAVSENEEKSILDALLICSLYKRQRKRKLSLIVGAKLCRIKRS